MTDIRLRGNASGSGEFSITPESSSSNRTINVPDQSGELLTNNSSLSMQNTSGEIPVDALPTGSIIQVVQAVSGSRSRITGSGGPTPVEPGINITPRYSNSLIMIMHTAGGMIDGGGGDSQGFGLQRNGSFIWRNSRYGYTSEGNWVPIPFHARVIDSPNTTSSVNYRFYMATEGISDFRHNDADGSMPGGFPDGADDAVTIAMEIKQ